MQSEYDPATRTREAVEFANSRFGQHYLARLESSKSRWLDIAMNDEFTDSKRAHAATRAETLGKEIEYFQIAQTVQDDPNLLQRMRANFERRVMKKKD